MNVSVPLPHSKYQALSLSPVTIDDASEMVVLLNDEETVKYLIGPPYPISIEQIKDYISSRPSVNGHCLAWAIRHNGRLIGEIGLEFKQAPQTYELGYYLSRHYWNNGITSLATKTYLNMMMKRIIIGEDITIIAGYIIDNFASGKILKKCEFIEVGHEEKMKNGHKLQGVKMMRIITEKEQMVDLDSSSY
ncbi:unnamed protein product [Rotaria sp. Silwood2]|nr:unnamed protein product [Rotaria sp. Silwood2]